MCALEIVPGIKMDKQHDWAYIALCRYMPKLGRMLSDFRLTFLHIGYLFYRLFAPIDRRKVAKLSSADKCVSSQLLMWKAKSIDKIHSKSSSRITLRPKFRPNFQEYYSGVITRAFFFLFFFSFWVKWTITRWGCRGFCVFVQSDDTVETSIVNIYI